MLVSHDQKPSQFALRLQETRERLIAKGDCEIASLREKLEFLDQLSEFEIGRFLIEHRGLNGRLSHYAFFEFPQLKRAGHSFHPLEDRLLTCHAMQSNQERYQITRQLLEPELFEGIRILSVPCGLMTELLHINYSKILKFELVGCDFDEESLQLARQKTADKGLTDRATFMLRDAWNLDSFADFHRVVSLGLNSYCKNRNSAVALYQSFCKALKPGGKLLVSYLTPLQGPDCEMDFTIVSESDQKFMSLYSEVLQLSHYYVCSSPQIADDLKSVGFSKVSFHYSKFRALNIAMAVK